MKTLADIKRRLQTGVVLECIENTRRPELNGSRRRVAKVQTRSFSSLGIAGWCDPKARESWTDFPPASRVEILDADTFRMALYADARDTVTLRFVVGDE